MKIAIIGTGYIGLITGIGLAELGNQVICVDVIEEKIEKLKKAVSTIYEFDLQEFLEHNISRSYISFTTNYIEAIKDAQIIFNIVDTPLNDDNSISLESFYKATEDIAKTLAKFPENYRIRIIVNKSTVPIGTADKVRNLIQCHYNGNFDVVSNPEFLREGQAMHDFFHPDRIVIGGDSSKSIEIMKQLYEPLQAPILVTDTRTAEMIKYASNAFLAMSISFINSLAELCEKSGSDVSIVSEGMKLDKRIGQQAFLDAGIGYGGSCFPKDIKGLISIANSYGVDLPILNATESINRHQRVRILEKIKKILRNIKDKKIAIWGLAFKPGTDDLREAPSIEIIGELLKCGAKVFAFDPVAEKNAYKIFPNVTFASEPLEVIDGADLLVIMTEWDEFKSIGSEKIGRLMKNKCIIDGRNIFNRTEFEKLGFIFEAIGR